MKTTVIRNNMAVTTLDNGCKMLTSYTTNVASITPDGEFTRHWNGYSATTMRHVNTFRELYGMDKINKKIWESMEVKRA
jgi:hypothetical protein